MAGRELRPAIPKLYLDVGLFLLHPLRRSAPFAPESALGIDPQEGQGKRKVV
jgi:hypothetical protein